MKLIKLNIFIRMKYFSYSLFLVALFSGSVFAQHTDSLDIKIGQMILIGFPKDNVDPEVLREIRQGKVGSIIIFEKNIPAKNSFVALKKITWTYQSAAPIPLFICIDQEGGKVNRLKDKYGFPRSITAAAMGKASTLDSVRFYSEATASTLAGLGINVNFAPVVDLASNPDNPIIAKFGRAFSANEDSVALMAKEVIKQHRKYGVITSLKHFPGHGSSKADTHLGVADVTNTWEDRELKPYQLLIDSGYTDAIMTSHIVNKKLDKSGNPGTLSADILTGILRKRLHFNGVVFTDDMQMHAITKHYGFEQAIKLAIQGGVDIMTFSNNIAGSDQRTVDKVHSIVRSMVEKGEISQARIDESFRRIMTLKKRLNENAYEVLQQQNTDRLQIELNKAQADLAAAQEALKAKSDELVKAQEAQAQEQPKKKKKKKKKGE
jgi:beta-N-acetylhexosaminidase